MSAAQDLLILAYASWLKADLEEADNFPLMPQLLRQGVDDRVRRYREAAAKYEVLANMTATAEERAAYRNALNARNSFK